MNAKASLVGWIAVASLALACSPKDLEPGNARTEATSKSSATTAEAAEEGLMSGSGLMAIRSIFANADLPGLYDAPEASADFVENREHLVTMGLSGAIAELESVSLFGDSAVVLRDVQKQLANLSENISVKALLLRVDGLAMSQAVAHELRNSLLAFKGEGARKLYCHIESADNLSYYILSACDSIGIAPTGEIVISGPAAMPMHLKGLLDKLGVKADFLHVGDYKGAAEPLTLDRPSEAMNTTLAGILDQSYATLVAAIAEGRKLSPALVSQYIDTAMFSSQEAVSVKLADIEASYEGYRAQVAKALPWKELSLVEREEPGMAMMMKMLGMQPATRSSDDHIALVYATGGIIDGSGDGSLGASKEIASRTLVPALRALAAADSVKAVVLRVDSGGGSALASELIWHAMNDLRAKKPVVVSMGGVAASGGYYISCGANRIFADEGTLTGSIGVVGGKLAIGGALEKLGVKSFPVGRGKRSMMWSTLSAWNESEREAIQKMMEDIYKVFVQRVADGRGKSYEEIHAIAQGRVWTGAAALENGLVDELGGLDTAIAHAEKLVAGTALGELEIYPPAPTLLDYIGSYAGGVQVSSWLGQQSGVIAELRHLLGPEASAVLERSLEQLSSFREASVQTTMLLPVLWR